MALEPGHKLGPYEIVGPIGKGGMGEVYRARDTKLDRDVAVKVLPDELAADEERIARFEREAKLLASLNHPNIASIYGFEEGALVLELVEGPTLAERIQQGPIPVDEAIAIAKQIAEALEAGHEASVIHRDLKPANVKVRDDGTVKVLDYGLAKALEDESATNGEPELSQSPTLTRQGTQIGVILGTAAYMSPEQARGRPVDRRTDIWAFGALLFEMLTGTKPFPGDDISQTLARVIDREPDWNALPGILSSSVETYLRRCLEKDPRQRVQAIGDVRLALEGAFETPTPPQGAIPPPSRLRPSIVLGLVLAGIASMAVWRTSRPVESPHPVTRFSLPLPPGVSLSSTTTGRGVALSADGTRLVFRANGQLYLRVIDQTVTAPIRGSVGADGVLFLSPDGEWVGFHSDGALNKLSVQGGSPIKLCEAELPFGAQWTTDNTIVFGQGDGIMRVSADGGTAEVLIPLPGDDEIAHGPQILPGEDSVLFTLGDHPGASDSQIVVESLQTGTRKVLIERGRAARYLRTGHLIYVLDRTLFAVPFDVSGLELTGSPIPVIEGVKTPRRMGGANYSVSDTGALVYGRPIRETNSLVWVRRDGGEEVLSAEPRGYFQPRISPDGNRVAVDVRDEDEDIWIWDFARETLTQLTFSPGLEHSPLWTPDGERVIYGSDRGGAMDIYGKAADGTGSAEPVHESPNILFPDAISPDGSQLVFSENTMSESHLGSIPLDGSSSAALTDEVMGWRSDISPDGRWLAYASRSTAGSEIYVRPFPNVGDGRWPISRGEGTSPRWSPDGSELFYIAPGAKLMAVPVETELNFEAGTPELITSGYYYYPAARNYDVSHDGERFLMIKESADVAEFEVVIHWFEELKRLVPTND